MLARYRIIPLLLLLLNWNITENCEHNVNIAGKKVPYLKNQVFSSSKDFSEKTEFGNYFVLIHPN